MKNRKQLLHAFGLLVLIVSACSFSGCSEQPTTTPTIVPTYTPTLFLTNTPTTTPTLKPTIAPTPDQRIYNPDNGHWYLFIDRGKRWHAAHTYCKALGAHLVTIEDDVENAFVYKHASDGWLGATDEDKEGEWKWVGGELMTYGNWAGGEPNNCHLESCVQENYLNFKPEEPSHWNDIVDHALPFLCEWDE